jgi:hypothetical protein
MILLLSQIIIDLHDKRQHLIEANHAPRAKPIWVPHSLRLVEKVMFLSLRGVSD